MWLNAELGRDGQSCVRASVPTLSAGSELRILTGPSVVFSDWMATTWSFRVAVPSAQSGQIMSAASSTEPRLKQANFCLQDKDAKVDLTHGDWQSLSCYHRCLVLRQLFQSLGKSPKMVYASKPKPCHPRLSFYIVHLRELLGELPPSPFSLIFPHFPCPL